MSKNRRRFYKMLFGCVWVLTDTPPPISTMENLQTLLRQLSSARGIIMLCRSNSWSFIAMDTIYTGLSPFKAKLLGIVVMCPVTYIVCAGTSNKWFTIYFLGTCNIRKLSKPL